MWDPKFAECGVVKVEYTRVRVFKDRYNYVTIDVGRPVQTALWGGDGCLNVYLGDGRVRRYRDRVNFITMG
jgi:hypothetical protein